MSSSDDIEARLAALPEPDLTDPDNPEWTEEDFARAVPVEQLPPDVQAVILAAFPNTRARLGRPPLEVRKTEVKLRLDPDIVAAFKADGPGWQTRINDTLKQAVLSKRA